MKISAGYLLLLCCLLQCGKGSSGPSGFPLLQKLAPANQLFKINPAQKNIIRAEKGSLFTIEADSFVLPRSYRAGDKIDIHLIEVTRSLEIAALPVNLEFTRKGRETLFESAGMFYIGAGYDDKPLELQKDRKIKVRFRSNVGGDKYYVYSHDAGKGWVKRGHNQEVTETPGLIAQDAGVYVQKKADGTPGVELKRSRRPVPSAPAKGISVTVAASDKVIGKEARKRRKVQEELYRVYEIDQLTWWNFDYPKPNLTCLKGKITGSDSDYFAITVFSRSELGAYTLYLPREFKISFYRNTYARVMAIDEKGNIAKTPFFETSDEIGHHKIPDSECSDVGPLKIQKIPEDILNDADKLRNYLQKEGR